MESFDLEFIPNETREGGIKKAAIYIIGWMYYKKILKRDDLFESKTDVSKTGFLQVLPQYMWHTIPVDFAVALHNPGALKYLFQSEVKKRKFLYDQFTKAIVVSSFLQWSIPLLVTPLNRIQK